MNRRSIGGLLAVALLFSACRGAETPPVPSTAPAPAQSRLHRDSIYRPTCNPTPGVPVGTITEYPIPLSGPEPLRVAVDASNNIWVTDYALAEISEYSASGTWSTYKTPTTGSEPAGITIGPDGNPWFTEEAGDRVGVVDESNGNSITEYALPSGFYPMGIDTNPDGDLYVADSRQPASGTTGKISQVTTAGGITSFASSGPIWEISSDSSGNIWYTSAEFGYDVVESTISGSVLATYHTTSISAFPYGITEGPPGTGMWFSEYRANKIGNISTSGTLTEYTIPSSGADANEIVAACGNLWFAEVGTGKIGELTPSGQFTEYKIPTSNSGPDGLAVDSNGNVWFAEGTGGKIGMITTSTTAYVPLYVSSVWGDDNGLYMVNGDSSGSVTPTSIIDPTSLSGALLGVPSVHGSNVYAENFGLNSIVAFPVGADGNVPPVIDLQGSNVPFGPYDHPVDVRFDGSGNLYAALGQSEGGSIAKFAPGATGNATPLQVFDADPTYAQFAGFSDFAVTTSGALWVPYPTTSSQDAPGLLAEYPSTFSGTPGTIATIEGSNTQVGNPLHIALDPSGNIYVMTGDLNPETGSYSNYRLLVFAANASGNVAPTREITGSSTGFTEPQYIAVDSSGGIYVADSQVGISYFAATANGNAAPQHTLSVGSNVGAVYIGL